MNIFLNIHELYKDHIFSIIAIRSDIIIFPKMQEITKMLSMDFIEKAIYNPLQNEQCIDMHGGTCNAKALSQFIMGCKSVYKMYLLVHLIPFIIFKRKKLFKKYLFFYSARTKKLKNWFLEWSNHYFLLEDIHFLFVELYVGLLNFTVILSVRFVLIRLFGSFCHFCSRNSLLRTNWKTIVNSSILLE